MQNQLERAVQLLDELGVVDVEHPSGSLHEHLQGTHDVLSGWGCPEYLCLAGMYHSVYGTETFQRETMSRDSRDVVRSAIGDSAERIAYLFCTIRRASLYENLERGSPYTVETRAGDMERLEGVQEFADLLTLDLANRLEQTQRVRYSRVSLDTFRSTYERAAPLLPALAVAEMRTTLPRLGAGNRLLRRALRAVRRLRST